MGAASVDHLEEVTDEAIALMAQHGTVAGVLPITSVFSRLPFAPAKKMLDAGVRVALATDFNPGTSPTVNFPLILTLGVSELRLSAAEAIVAATVNGAAALALAGETGQLAPGFAADLALFEIEDLRELPYWYGDRRCMGTWALGLPCHPYGLSVT